MGRLTPEERRRVFHAQSKARGEMLNRVLTEPAVIVTVAQRFRRQRRLLFLSAIVATALGGGWLAYQAVEFEFHPPTSIVEALLPRR
jgi:hypothetical protein